MSKLKPQETPVAARPKAWGPLFKLIRESDGQVVSRWCIESVDHPTDAEIISTAEHVVRKVNTAYRTTHHWERIYPEPPSEDGLRGEPARREAFGRILAGPDTLGKRFLQNRKGRSVRAALAESMTPDIPAPVTTASRGMIDRLSEPMELTGNPLAFDPKEHPVEEE